MRYPFRGSGELTVCVSHNDVAFTSRLAGDPERNIRKSLVSAITDFHTLQITTNNLIVNRVCFVC